MDTDMGLDFSNHSVTDTDMEKEIPVISVKKK